MFLTKPILKLSIKHYRNSRSIRNFVDRIDKQIADGSIIKETESSRLLIQNPLIFVDIGARGGSTEATKNFHEFIHFVVCDADPNASTNLNNDFKNSKITVIKNAIAESRSERNLYLTEAPGASSLLSPSGHSLSLRGGDSRDISRFKVKREISVTTSPLSTSLETEVSFIDILKVDVQGLEFEVLQGLGTYRPFLICAECSTVELYLGQKTVFGVGSMLEKIGYMPIRMMELQLVPRTSAKYQSSIPVHGDVIFVPDNSANGRAIIERDVEKWFASLCMHGYMDFAFWQLEELNIPKPPLVTQTEELLTNS